MYEGIAPGWYRFEAESPSSPPLTPSRYAWLPIRSQRLARGARFRELGMTLRGGGGSARLVEASTRSQSRQGKTPRRSPESSRCVVPCIRADDLDHEELLELDAERGLTASRHSVDC